MRQTLYYMVAEHLFCVEADETLIALMANYEPFRTEAAHNSDALFSLSVTHSGPVSYIEEWRQEEEGQDTICGHTEQGEPVFGFRFNAQDAGWLICTPGYHTAGMHGNGAVPRRCSNSGRPRLYVPGQKRHRQEHARQALA